MATLSPKERWLDSLHEALHGGSLVKLTLGGYAGSEAGLKNLHVRSVELRAGPQLSFVYRYATKDVTKNFPYEEGQASIAELLGSDFHTGHLFTTSQNAQIELRPGRKPKLILSKAAQVAPSSVAHDRKRARAIGAEQNRWLNLLDVTTAEGTVREGMTAKFRQIGKFTEILQHSLAAAKLIPPHPLRLMDMGCGKGYLTFAARDLLERLGWKQAEVRGVEVRPELVELCNRASSECGFQNLRFEPGVIANTPLERVEVLVALHACDTATDDAIAKGIQAGALLIVVAPCCHKELRPQLQPPSALVGALRHGILLEREAEFVTDALRAALLEWAGYETKVFEFISPEHTSKNLMITAVRRGERGAPAAAQRARDLADFYRIKRQTLAERLGFALGR
jgi:SAM-dependent methyltransferase